MGCCLSLRTTDEHRRHPHGGATKSPPPEEQEETVKEVLLETPIPPKSPPISNKEKWKTEVESTAVINHSNNNNNNNHTPQNPNEVKEVIVSEVTEKCDLGERFAAAPPRQRAVVRGGERNQRLNASSNVGVRRKAPATPAVPTAEKRAQVAPLRAVSMQRRNVEAGKGGQRDGGEGSGRLINPPAVRKDGASAIDTAREVGVIGNGGGDGGAREGGDDVVLGEQEECETLENPVVSLECFIFL